MSEDTAPSPALQALMSSTRSTSTTLPLDRAREKKPTTSNSATSQTSGPIPMSMPAILIQPKNKHLLGALGKKAFNNRDENAPSTSSTRKGKESGIPGGRRRRRRWENAQLAGNPHLHRPTRADFNPGPSLKGLSTTFAPPPTNFSRSTYSSPESTTNSSSPSKTSFESGQFSMSLRGLRKNLRTSVVGARVTRGQGGRTEEVLEIMERELQEWLSFQGRVSPGFYHDGTTISTSKVLDPTPLEDWQPPPPIESLPDEPTSRTRPTPPPPSPPATLVELTRLPHTLVWLAPFPLHRYLLHSLARYYRLQSFSRPLSPLDPSTRVTHILQPQLTRPTIPTTTRGGISGFDTPSATDWSSGSALSTEVSATETETETETEESEAEFTEGSIITTDDEDGLTTDGESVVQDGREEGRTLEDLELSSSGESEYGADRELGFSTDDEDEEAGLGRQGYVDSLASSFADINVVDSGGGIGSAVPSTPTSISTTPRRSSLPFLPYTPTPPSTSLPSSLSISTTPRPTITTRARGRRSIPNGGRDSVESSPSRSPTRVPEPEVVVTTSKGEWKLPDRSFVDWVFA
ncbi:hypothetical protein JCM5350_005474 [Sporobolomyces pararoseus]